MPSSPSYHERRHSGSRWPCVKIHLCPDGPTSACHKLMMLRKRVVKLPICLFCYKIYLKYIFFYFGYLVHFVLLSVRDPAFCIAFSFWMMTSPPRNNSCIPSLGGGEMNLIKTFGISGGAGGDRLHFYISPTKNEIYVCFCYFDSKIVQNYSISRSRKEW